MNDIKTIYDAIQASKGTSSDGCDMENLIFGDNKPVKYLYKNNTYNSLSEIPEQTEEDSGQEIYPLYSFNDLRQHVVWKITNLISRLIFASIDDVDNFKAGEVDGLYGFADAIS